MNRIRIFFYFGLQKMLAEFLEKIGKFLEKFGKLFGILNQQSGFILILVTWLYSWKEY